MTGDEFDFLCRMLKERSGLVLTRDKAYLLESRPHRRYQFIHRLEIDLARDIVEAMTTNETFFFRDIKPFDQFKQVVLPYLLQARGTTRHIKVWSAACSSGQEPYTLSMMLKEERQKLIGWNVD